jgi:hypothetical protein
MRKETVIIWFEVLSWTCLEGVKKTVKTLNRDSQMPALNVNLGIPKHEACAFHSNMKFVQLIVYKQNDNFLLLKIRFLCFCF